MLCRLFGHIIPVILIKRMQLRIIQLQPQNQILIYSWWRVLILVIRLVFKLDPLFLLGISDKSYSVRGDSAKYLHKSITKDTCPWLCVLTIRLQFNSCPTLEEGGARISSRIRAATDSRVSARSSLTRSDAASPLGLLLRKSTRTQFWAKNSREKCLRPAKPDSQPKPP